MTIPEPVGFADLTTPEQIEYLQHLWDRIAARPEAVPVPKSHLVLTEQRLAEHRRNPQAACSPFVLLDRLNASPE